MVSPMVSLQGTIYRMRICILIQNKQHMNIQKIIFCQLLNNSFIEYLCQCINKTYKYTDRYTYSYAGAYKNTL